MVGLVTGNWGNASIPLVNRPLLCSCLSYTILTRQIEPENLVMNVDCIGKRGDWLTGEAGNQRRKLGQCKLGQFFFSN